AHGSDRGAAPRGPHGGPDRRLPESGRIQPTEAMRRVLPRTCPPIADTSRPGEREGIHRSTRAERVVVAEAGRGDSRLRRQARRVGTPRVGPIPKDACPAPVGALGRSPGTEAASQTGSTISSWRCRVSTGTHDAKGAGPWPPILQEPS